MPFIKVGELRINVDHIVDYGPGNRDGIPITGMTYIGNSRDQKPVWLNATPEEVDAFIAEATAKEIRDYHRVVDELVAEDEERRGAEKDAWQRECEGVVERAFPAQGDAAQGGGGE